jgi:hypothetical protein
MLHFNRGLLYIDDGNDYYRHQSEIQRRDPAAEIISKLKLKQAI